MITTIDKAGRLVIPKPLREQVGLTAGQVKLVVVGSTLQIEPLTDDDVVEQDGRLIVPPSGAELTQEVVDALRRVDQR